MNNDAVPRRVYKLRKLIYARSMDCCTVQSANTCMILGWNSVHFWIKCGRTSSRRK